VSGVGPRLAQTILSGMPAPELAAALIGEEIGRLTQISGVGKKTAERLVLELKDKLKTSGLLGRTAQAAVPLSGSGALVSALLNLGYKPAAAERTAEAVRRSLGPAAAVEDQLREALRLISGAP
jgi:holliday junction DNA helicase RuvA